MPQNVHASCVVVDNKGVLITGASGAGKSDLSLRLIAEQGAKLVADDRVDLQNFDGEIIASPPQILAGLFEIRGLGIVKQPYQKQASIKLVVELVSDSSLVDRFPKDDFYELEGIMIKRLRLCSFEASITAKIIVALSLL